MSLPPSFRRKTQVERLTRAYEAYQHAARQQGTDAPQPELMHLAYAVELVIKDQEPL